LFLSFKNEENGDSLPITVYQVFFKENVRYPVWTCRDPISLFLGTRW